MSDSDTRRRFSFWWWLAAVVVLLVVLPILAHFYSTSEYFAPELIISRETTYITEPLTPEGLPDYVHVIQQHAQRGVTPENNAVVLLLEALGSRPDGEPISPEVFRRVGVSWPGEEAESFLSVEERLKRHFAGDEEAAEELLARLYEQPWHEGQSPQAALMARWLQELRPRLDLAVEASRRPRFYTPAVVPPGGSLFDARLVVLVGVRSLMRHLQLRAMWHLGHGRPRQAWEDLLALRRLSRLVAQHWAMVGTLLGSQGENQVAWGLSWLLAHGVPDEATARAWLEQWRQHPPQADFATVVGWKERLAALDTVLYLRRKGRPIPHELEKDFNIRLLPGRVDWNHLLRRLNRRFDEIVAFGRRDDLPTLQWQVIRWRQEADARFRDPMLWLFSLFNRSARSERFSCAVVEYFTAPLDVCKMCELRNRQRHLLGEAALALAVYRARHGHYPEKLDALVPELLPQVPPDLFAPGTTLIYRRKGDGYVLYSVGRNGADDGGLPQSLKSANDLGFFIQPQSKRRLPLMAPPMEGQP